MAITELDVRSSSRLALGVRRYHVWPMLQEQRTDAHSLQMLRIYCCVWGPPSPAVAWAIVWHDAGESDAGDCQFGAKRRYPALKRALDECEEAQIDLLYSTDVVEVPTEEYAPTLEESWRVKACDLIDGLEHALTDVAMGNLLAVPVVDAYAGALEAHRSGRTDNPLTDYLARPWHQRLLRICEARRKDTK